MAFSYGFFNSHSGDRTYSAKQFGSIFDGIINDGVFRTIGNKFSVSAGDGMKVKVGSGRGWFCHTWVLNSNDYTVSVPQSEVLLNRVDALVLEIDHRDEFRRTRLTVLKGPAENLEPTWPPTSSVKDMFNFWDTDEQKQIPIAYIRVLGKATTINGSDIFSVVGKVSYGGPAFVTGPLETVDLSIIYDQIAAQWDEFVERAEFEFNDIDSKYNDFVSRLNVLYQRAQDEVNSIINSLNNTFNVFMNSCSSRFDNELASYHRRFDEYLESANNIFQHFMRTHNQGFNEFVDLKNSEFNTKLSSWDAEFISFKRECDAYLGNQKEIWEEWFQYIQGRLSDDEATNLQRQIDALSYCYVLGERAILGIVASAIHERAVFGTYGSVMGNKVSISAPSTEPNYLNN